MSRASARTKALALLVTIAFVVANLGAPVSLALAEEWETGQEEVAVVEEAGDNSTEPVTATADSGDQSEPVAAPTKDSADILTIGEEGQAGMMQNGCQFPAAPSEEYYEIKAGYMGLTQEQIDGTFNTLLTAMANKETFSIDLSEYELNVWQFEALFAQVVNTHPEFCFATGDYGYSGGSLNHVEHVFLKYTDDNKDALNAMSDELYDAVEEVLSWIPEDATRTEQVKAVHDWLCRNVEYNYRAADLGYDRYGVTSEDNPWSAYGALVNHSAVCQGYTLAMGLILNELGIKNEYCNTKDHIWNYVQIDTANNVWFHVDVTWDDRGGGFDTTPSQEYFLQGNRYFRATHDEWTCVVGCYCCPCVDRSQEESSADFPSVWPVFSGPVDDNIASYRTDLSGAEIGPIPDQPYDYDSRTGEAEEWHPLVDVTLNGKLLSNAEDYSLTYQDNKEVGVATVVVRGRNGYRGQAYATFNIVEQVDIANCDVASTPDQTYTGTEIRPGFHVTYDTHASFRAYELYEGEDSSYTVSYSNNVNVGTAKATIKATGDGWYCGTKTVTFKIVPADIANATVVAIPQQTYTGKALRPSVKLTFNDNPVSTDDYTVTYSNNTNAGTAKVTIAGKGNFKGTTSATFKIVQKGSAKTDISKATVSSIADQTYTGKAITPKPVVKVGSTTLKSGTDYTLSYKNNTNVGTATVTITGKGNYTGAKSVTFKIVKKAEPSATQEMYRLYNPNSGEHFYTAKAAERDALKGVGWVYEGVGWTAPSKSNTPVYRLYNEIAGDHHYTMKAAERDALLKINGWVDEGIGWYSDDAQGTPLYRQYNPNAVTGSHNYTTKKAENDALVKMGWIAEDIGWYGVKQ